MESLRETCDSSIQVIADACDWPNKLILAISHLVRDFPSAVAIVAFIVIST